MSVAEMLPGTQVDKYRISHLLGDGGMGAVYAAEHVVLARRAAIKVLHPHIASNPEIVRRFINEAMGAASLDHRNIVRVLDCGQLPGNGQWYIALDFLDGESLGAFMGRTNGPIDLATALHILAEASNGLHAAHERNYVHRDVKPDNFFLTRTPDDPIRVVVLDFGIAKLNQPSHSGVDTRSNIVMGTPAYMAPEQLRDSKDVDRRADIFALGVIAYEMATGTRPWGATTSLYDIIAQHSRMTSPPDPRQLRADIPGPWASVVARAMEPDPNRRWQTAKEFAWALAEATPMPFSRNGTALLEKVAPELVISSTDSMTVGRPVPAELLSPAPRVEPVTAPLRPAPASVSDGVPRNPSYAPPGTAVMPVSDAVPAGPISTIAGSSGQAVAPPHETAPRRSRGLIVGLAVTGLVVGGALALLLTREKGDTNKPSTSSSVAVDAAVAAKAPELVRVPIESQPVGAAVTVDGISLGVTPTAAEAEVGKEIVVRATLDGHEVAERRIHVTAEAAPVQLVMAPQPVAAEPALDAGVVAEPVAREGRRSGKRKERGASTGAGAASGSGAGQGSGTGKASGTGGRFTSDDVLD